MRGVQLCIGKGSLIKQDMTTNDTFVVCHIKILIFVMVRRIPKKYTWCGARLEFVDGT